MNTIYALSTPLGRAAIGIIRISGPDAVKFVKKLAPSSRPWVANQARLTNLRWKTGVLDQALLLYFAEKHSYTGEQLIELHCHGSPPVLSAVMQALSDAGCRHAEPGEFTKRAFYNGRLDLTKVEGIRDLLNAETELQRQLAVAGASGKLAKTYDLWRSEILNNTAMLTALIDFADDNEIETSPNSLVSKVYNDIHQLHGKVMAHTLRIQQTELISSGINMVIIGEPNAGKSSLVNRLVNRAACIVSEVPGTTRDVVQVNLDIGGYKVVIGDTAGIRNVTSHSIHDELEKVGIERARAAVANANILMAVLPLDKPTSTLVLAEIQKAKENGIPTIIVGNKADLGAKDLVKIDADVVEVSSKTGDGFDELINQIADQCAAASGTTSTSSEMIGASRRTGELLDQQVLPGLSKALEMLNAGDVILASAELQIAAEGISKITGNAIGVNEVLDVVFGSFCIGK